MEGQRRDAATLLPIIKNYVLKGFCINLIEFRFFKGSEIHTDFWAAYNNISQMGMNYIHKTVNHKENFIDEETGAHTIGRKSMAKSQK